MRYVPLHSRTPHEAPGLYHLGNHLFIHGVLSTHWNYNMTVCLLETACTIVESICCSVSSPCSWSTMSLISVRRRHQAFNSKRYTKSRRRNYYGSLLAWIKGFAWSADWNLRDCKKTYTDMQSPSIRVILQSLKASVNSSNSLGFIPDETIMRLLRKGTIAISYAENLSKCGQGQKVKPPS